MKSIAVYFTQPHFTDYPFNKQDYRDGYALLATLVAQRGGSLSIVRDEKTYRGNNTFEGSWEFREGEFHRQEGPRSFDLIFNKGKLSPLPDAHVINDPELDAICTDKARTYALFEELSPRTVIARSQREFDDALEALASNVVVAKPVDGEEGHGVHIGTRDEVKSSVRRFPYLIQELIDTDGGIPGIAPGRHDFRLISVAGEIAAAFVRIPAEGKYVANVAQGGTMHGVPRDAIPESALEIFHRVDREFARFPQRVYSLDLGLDRGKHWKIIELNAQPGLSIEDYNDGPEGQRVFHRIADLLTS